ncbi:hypothetical protein GRAN_0260 [Granulicella sibirica]|uniref:Uncharacterized protein n=1 Tax=Granulicella sibirica TaxID=2479048 RepID=A0A4Q0T3A3_9BACT|nr:hypothetical protein GRAN_0260 [Granulicella sibirica]
MSVACVICHGRSPSGFRNSSGASLWPVPESHGSSARYGPLV